MATSTIKYQVAIFSKMTYQSNVSVATTDTQFKVEGSRTGYIPISYSLIYGYSSQIIAGVEQCTMSDGTFSIRGYARSMSGNALNVGFIADVWWVKNI